MPTLVLASASPRRSDLLRSLGLCFDVVVTDTDETRFDGEHPAIYVERLARAKAAATAGVVADDALVIAADTTVALDDAVLGKPADEAEATAMLRSLSARAHTVFTGVALRHGDATVSTVAATTVWFRALDDATIAWHLATGEAYDKAGGYGMQGYGGAFVERIDGSPSNVVGLPVHVLDELASTLGFDLRDFRAP